MSLLKRLYNVAYGRVRLWQSGEEPVAPELDRLEPAPEPVRDAARPIAREEPVAVTEEAPPAPRPRRL